MVFAHAADHTKLVNILTHRRAETSRLGQSNSIVHSSKDQSISMTRLVNSSTTTAISAMHPPGSGSLETRLPGETSSELHHCARDFVTEAGLAPRGYDCSGSWGSMSASEARLCSSSGSGLAGTLTLESTHEGWFGGGRSNGGAGSSTSSSECHV